MTREEYWAHVEAVVDEAPPITEEQRAQLAPLYRIGIQRVRERRAREATQQSAA